MNLKLQQSSEGSKQSQNTFLCCQKPKGSHLDASKIF